MTSHMTKIEAARELYRALETLDAGAPGFDIMQAAALDLRRAAMRLQTLGERECNGVIGPDGYAKWDDDDQAKNDKARLVAANKAIKAIESVCDSETFPRLQIEFQGDPRGAPILIHEKDGRERIAVFW